MSWLIIFAPLVASIVVFSLWILFSGFDVFVDKNTLKGILEVLRREL